MANYIILNNDNIVNGYYSDERMVKNSEDILLPVNNDRNLNLNLRDDNYQLKLKWDSKNKKIIERTQQEIFSSQAYIKMLDDKKREQMIALKMKIMAGTELGFDMTKEQAELMALTK
jgi:hypothetical protein